MSILLFFFVFSVAAAAAADTTPPPNLKCLGKYSDGETFYNGNFVMRCSSSPFYQAVKAVACLSQGKKEIPLNGQIEEGPWIRKCISDDKGIRIEDDVAKPGCNNGAVAVGATFLSENKRFVMKCLTKYGSTEAIACKTDDGQEIAMGTDKIIGNIKHFCTKKDNKVQYYIEPIPSTENMKCLGQYTNGQKFNQGNFVKQCISTPYNAAVRVVACLSQGKKEIPLNGQIEEGAWIRKCIHDDKGTRIEDDVAKPGCNNGAVAIGATFLSANQRFVYKCADKYGNYDIVACKTGDGKQEVAVGSEKIIGNIKHRCTKEGDSVRYSTEFVKIK